MKKIFISYTLKDGEITCDFLKELKYILSKIDNVNTYIDILDNNNIQNPQFEVFNQLYSSDFFWIINSSKIHDSEWVSKELSFAQSSKIPIFYIDVLTLKKVIDRNSIELAKEFIISHTIVESKEVHS